MSKKGKTAQEIKIQEFNSRKMNKKIQKMYWFFAQIGAGKTAVIISPDYVVCDWKTWKRLNEKAENKEIMFFDEASEITSEMWDIIQKRIDSAHYKYSKYRKGGNEFFETLSKELTKE